MSEVGKSLGSRGMGMGKCRPPKIPRLKHHVAVIIPLELRHRFRTCPTTVESKLTDQAPYPPSATGLTAFLRQARSQANGHWIPREAPTAKPTDHDREATDSQGHRKLIRRQGNI